MHELIVIGAGPAGITASVYAARKVMNFLVVSKDIGGQTALSGDIENYTGYQFITGPELTDKFEEHMRKYDVKLKEGEEVIELKKEDGVVEVKTNRDTYQTKTVIIASGKRSRQLNVPGEVEFKNRGLTYCATCDGPLFSKKDVAIIGGGNSALDAALQMIKIARRIYLINNTTSLGGDRIMMGKVIENKSITIFNNSEVTAILGEGMVKEIKIHSFKEISNGVKIWGKEEILKVQGVFVEIGLIPNSEFTREIDKNKSGEIKVDSYNRTNIPGIFAAGDVTDVPEKQIIIAAGEGSKAALGVFKYLSEHN